MNDNTMILGENRFYSMDSYKTKLNNNVLIVGASGAGKTRSFVSPNLLAATGSYIVVDPKGNLYGKYRDYLEKKGYVVKKLNFADPKDSIHYNFMEYINSPQDCIKIAHMLICGQEKRKTLDPFWEDSSKLLLQALLGYFYEKRIKEREKEAYDKCKCVFEWEEPGLLPDKYTVSEEKIKARLKAYGIDTDKMVFVDKVTGNFGALMGKLADMKVDENNPNVKSRVDAIMDHHGAIYPDSFAYRSYQLFHIATGKTLRSIIITVNSKLGIYDTPEIEEMMSFDEVDISSIGREKTALFVVVSDTDRSMDGMVNIFFTQAMNELCRYADRECEDNRLPVPVRFILDDFATNCRIEGFPRMIASVRSRGISTMLMIQAESQLKAGYGDDAETIIGNCDTYVYLGGNDVETARKVSERCDVPLKRILNMPIGTNWIFRRGQEPVNGVNLELESFEHEMEKGEQLEDRN